MRTSSFRTLRRIHGLTACLLAAIVCATSTIQAAEAPPEYMAYQSYLVDGNGDALGLSSPENYAVIFRIYDALIDGTLLWAEQQAVTVDKGYFSVLLGEGADNGGEPRPALSSVFEGATASDRYIGITVKGIGSGGSDVDIMPRLQLVSSSYAFMAATATKVLADAIDSSQIADGTITSSDIEASAVGSSEIAVDAVGSSEIAAGAVGSSEIAAGAVGSSEIAAGAVGSSEIAADAVGSSKINDRSIAAVDIGYGTITGSEIKNGTIGSSDIQEGLRLPAYAGVNGSSVNVAFTVQQDSGDSAALVLYDSSSESIATFRKPNPTVALTLYGKGAQTGGGSWLTNSDERLKQNITHYTAGLDEIVQLRPVRYRYRDIPERGLKSSEEHIGLIAQEVQLAIPEAVSTDSDGYLSLDADPIHWASLNAIKELAKENAELKNRLLVLEEKVEALLE